MENQVPAVKAPLHTFIRFFRSEADKHSNAPAHTSRADIEVAVFSFPRRVADVQIAAEHDVIVVVEAVKSEFG